MGAFRTVNFAVCGIFYRIVSSSNSQIVYKIIWKLTLLLLCLLLTTTTTSTTAKKNNNKMLVPATACSQVMNDGSKLDAIHFLLQDHPISEFLPLSRVLQDRYNDVIDDTTVLNTFFSDTLVKDKLKSTALDLNQIGFCSFGCHQVKS